MDHAGGNPHFPNTPIYVQQTEADAAIGNLEYAPPEFSRYIHNINNDKCCSLLFFSSH
ncbi:hypothetical protein MMB75_06125 [Paenibacillus sp. P2(2022)]|nr:hypothetical protein [Paenibacillus sp. P2(2022)]MDG0053250.1 hypothetical protein [Paenibacillus sp. P2(2022)]